MTHTTNERALVICSSHTRYNRHTLVISKLNLKCLKNMADQVLRSQSKVLPFYKAQESILSQLIVVQTINWSKMASETILPLTFRKTILPDPAGNVSFLLEHMLSSKLKRLAYNPRTTTCMKTEAHIIGQILLRQPSLQKKKARLLHVKYYLDHSCNVTISSCRFH